MTGFRTPPQDDFHAYSALMKKQGDHLAQLTQWSGNECADTGGLDGLLLLPLLEIVPAVSQFVTERLAQCQRGMGLIDEKIQRTSADYTRTDEEHAKDLLSIYPAGTLNFPDISALPGGSLVGNFTDEDVTLKPPPSAEEDTSKSIKHQLMLLSGKSEIKAADKMFRFCTGQSLVELLFRPLFGEYGRLRYLHDAYDELGDGVYTVAGTLRKGSWKLGSEWSGQTATAFDEYLFRWSMGIGGVGDAAKTAAKAYHDGYDIIVGLVFMALREIDTLINNEIKELAEQAAEMAAGDAAIEVAGGGPEDPLADIGAGIYTAYKLYKIYKIVQRIINTIATIVKIYEKIQEAVETIKKDVHAIMEFINSPMPSIGSLIDDVEQRGFEFEKSGGWSPTVGAARIAMIPAA